ncbi:MAG: tRNA pseudouridine(55) synthase TruB [Chloroflexi bacterium]|nr:tRNA pseudouridine(55) synthase TruB [Chloroflexota bacterium]
MSADGILNVHKPTGKTSFEIVSLVRRLSKERRVGHGGTLDPTASGVLTVGLGQGTRILAFLAEAKKRYRAHVRLGIVTDSYDSVGRVVECHDPSAVTKEQLEETLPTFQGTIQQIPPLFSALKWQGKPLHRWVREGLVPPIKARPAQIFQLKLVDWMPPLVTIDVECGKGTYIRSLAHDLGQALGCGAHLDGLIRLSCGPFTLEDSLTLPELQDAFEGGYWQKLLYPLDVAILHWPAAILGETREAPIRYGQALPLNGRDKAGERCRAYSLAGQLIALLRYQPQTGLWHPEKVFSQ